MNSERHFTYTRTFRKWLGTVTIFVFLLCLSKAAVGQDSIVQITAEVQGLEQVSAVDLAPFGTYWEAMPGASTIVPLPCSPFDTTLPIYTIVDGIYLVDATKGQLPPGDTVPAMEAVSNAVVNVINQVQMAQFTQSMRALGLDFPSPPGGGGGGGGGYTNNAVIYTFNTNLLWLEITNVSSTVAYVNMHNGTNQVYSIWATTNLLIPFSLWPVETEVFPTTSTTNCLSFSIPTRNRQNLFLRAEDWTGITENGNTTPQWWFWHYFDSTGLSDTNLDSQGNSLASDYQNGVDPNLISFWLSDSNQFINSNATLQINLTAGEPFYFATLVDCTNFDEANWAPYTSSNISVSFGSTQGWNNVWVGLRGFAPDSTQTWQQKHMYKASLPILIITNPTSFVVDKPFIQIYGYCQAPLAKISYDISNAMQFMANQPAEITDQYYDTNTLGFTTNYFECLDVPLISGSNTLTIHATDFAGNSIATNFNFTLDYLSKTNPPSVEIAWPKDGITLSGNCFTCRGVLADPTANVITQMIFTNGSTNVFTGGFYTNIYVASVERNGTFWLENLPLNPGTNSFSIKIIDVVGNTTYTNISVIKSALSLSINPVTPDSQLWQSTVNITGAISDPTYAIWVNGVKGHNNGDGTWLANNVPVNNGGTASFTATAYSAAEQQPDGSYGN